MRLFGLFIMTGRAFDEIIAIWSDRVRQRDERLRRAGIRVNALREKLWVAQRGGYQRARPQDAVLDEMLILGYDEHLSYQPGRRLELEARISLSTEVPFAEKLTTDADFRVAFRGLSWIVTDLRYDDAAFQRMQSSVIIRRSLTLTLVAYADPSGPPGPFAAAEPV